MTNKKPWNDLDFNSSRRPEWMWSSHNKTKRSLPICYDTIEAIIIVQDCNQAGEYFRYFWWNIAQSQGCLDIERLCYIGKEWSISDKKLVDLIDDEIIIIKDNKFIVKSLGSSGFIKLLEKIDK